MAITKPFYDIAGVTGESFAIGYTRRATFILQLTQDENNEPVIELYLDRALNLGDLPFKTTYRPTNDEDLCNLKAVMERLEATETSAYNYIDEKIREITGGTTGGNVMLSPMLLNIENLTPGEDQSFSFGSLSINKFIDRVIFEVQTPFFVTDPKSLAFSIGTSEAAKEDIVPKFTIDTLQSTKVVNVEKTLTAQSDIHLFTFFEDGTAEPDPGPDYDPEFEQTLTNQHEDVTGQLGTDADGDIIEISLTGTNLVGSVLSTETFGEITGNYMDFAVSIPMKASGDTHYRIVQQNPALEIYDGRDQYISNQGGIWTKDREYLIPEGSGASQPYEFLLTESTGETDYIHIYIYDLDAEDPSQIIRTYHIKNGLSFADADATVLAIEPETATLDNVKKSIFFAGADDASMGITMDDEKIATVTLSGVITSYSERFGNQFPWLSDKLNVTMLSVECDSTNAFRWRIQNPAMDGLETILDYVYVSEDGYAYCEGYVSAGSGTSNTVFLDIPVTADKGYPIRIELIDPATNEITFTINVMNQLTFNVQPPAEESAPVGEIVGSFNLPAETSDTPTADQGSMRIRILSF